METSVTQSTKRPSLTEDNDELARDYDRVSVDRQLQSGKMLVRDLAPRAGERVLDVGCGTGLLAQHIADLVGPTGHVLGVDPLPLRIELAQPRRGPISTSRLPTPTTCRPSRPPVSTSCASTPFSTGCRKRPGRSVSLPVS